MTENRFSADVFTCDQPPAITSPHQHCGVKTVVYNVACAHSRVCLPTLSRGTSKWGDQVCGRDRGDKNNSCPSNPSHTHTPTHTGVTRRSSEEACSTVAFGPIRAETVLYV